MSLILGPLGGQIVYPPRTRNWYEVLPAPFNEDIGVVCVMRPVKWQLGSVDTKDGKFRFFILRSPSGSTQGLQVCDVNLDTWVQHQRVFSDYRIEMANPAFIGPLSRFPQTLPMELDRAPMLFVRDAMWKTFLDLRSMWTPQERKA